MKLITGGFNKFRQRLTFPGSHPPSIISAEELNFRVRNGNGWDLFAIITEFEFYQLNNAEMFQASSQTYSHLSFRLAFQLGQVLDLLVSISLTCHHAYTFDLSTT